MEKQFSIVIILFLSLLADLPAQISIQRDVVGAGGGQIGSLSFGSLEWTLGEFMTERLQTDQTLITQGFHQPFLIIDNIAEATPNILIEAFPNPTASILHLKTATSTPLDVKLLDLTGKEILSKHFALGTQLDFFKKVPKGENTQLELWVDLPPQRFVDGVLITDTDPLNEIQKLLKDGGFISLSKNGGLILLEDDDPVNELQDLGYETESSPEGQIGKLSINGAGYSEEWGDTIVIEDVDPINELQELRYEVGEGPSGLLGKISITGGFMGGLWGRTFTINDVDPNNELQKIVSGGIRPSSVHPIGWNKLLLLQEFIPDDPTDNDYVEVDAHPENELQLLQFDEDRALLSVTKGNEVDLSSLATPWRKADTFDVPPPAIHYSGTAIGKSYQTESQEILIQKDAFRIKQAFSELDFARLAKTQFGGREGGYLGLYQAGATRIFANAGEAGDLKLYGGNNSLNVRISHLDGSPNHGHISVHHASGGVTAGIFTDPVGFGVVFADVKNFRMPHPKEVDKEIWYASIEGPEAAAYERGTFQLTNGEAFVPFSDHFQIVGNMETMTVVLTPLSADTQGLAVVEKTARGFKVKELLGGTGNFAFDWEAKCVRKGHEDYQVIRDKSSFKAGQ